MRSTFVWAIVLILAIAANSAAQDKAADPPAVVPLGTAGQPANAKENLKANSDSDKGDKPRAALSYTYVPPSPRSRFKSYINDTIGPVALMSEAVSAGVTTGRNAPKEWGATWEGFGRRFASNMGKNVIKQTTTYALDEALDLDSRFHRSRDRSVAARFRNALFSSVTARNRQGRRVIGIPKIAGSVLANVTSAQFWYPGRYNYVHGLKGGAISLGLDVAINLTKEFVWK